MARSVNVSQADTKASKERGTFEPLPAGDYNVSIFDLQEKEYGNGVNKGRPYLALQLRISEGQKGTNRRLFTNVGDFARWNPKDGAEEGKINFQFFSFYRALGVQFDGVDGDVTLPDLEDLKGADLAVKVAIVNDTYAFEQAINAWKKDKDKVSESNLDAWEEKNPRPEQKEFKKNEVKDFLLPKEQDEFESGSDDDEDEFDFGD